MVVILIVSLLSYGIYLNEKSESQIALRMSERRLPLHGAKVTARNIYPVIKMDFINFYSNEMVDVTALIDGKINNFFVERNTFVHAGDSVAEIFNEEIPLKIKQADSDILEAEAALTRAQNTFNRYAQLVEMDAISKQKFDEAKADFESAKARLENYRAKRAQISITQTRQVITAPINGEILKFYKQFGAYVTAGTPVVLIGNFEMLHFDTNIVNDISRLEIGQSVEISFTDEKFSKSYGSKYSVGNKGSKQIFNAKLIDISPPMTQPAEIRKLTWELDNTVGLLEPGFYENAEIHSPLAKKCLTIPRNATFDTKNNFVYVVEDGTLKLREIVSGVNDKNFLEVIDGLNEGDIVITSSPEGLSEGLQVEVTLDEEAN